jgi:hypothetical protein
MSDGLKEILIQPFKEFYTRCQTIYRLGDTTLYLENIFKIKTKYCFNPYLSTECDVQVKLGGLIEEHLRKNQLPFIVNAEMKLYNNERGKNNRADLSIHKTPDNNLYLQKESAFDSLVAIVEIKYANAIHPYYEFDNKKIEKDIEKLASLDGTILKYLVLIDEANKIDKVKVNHILEACQLKNILLFSNNPEINQISFN